MAGKREKKAETGAVKSVHKVLDILEHLGGAGRPVSVSDIARSTGVNVSTAYRLLQNLAARGYVEQDGQTRSYRLGPRTFALGSAYLGGNDLIQIARPHLVGLRDAIGETVYLATYSRGEVVQLAKADGNHVISARMPTGQREPAYCTANGKVLLASLDEPELARYLDSAEFRQRTVNTITTETRLRKELQEIARLGFAVDDEELTDNVCCVSAPVRESTGRVIAALSIAMPKSRFRRAAIPSWVRQMDDKATLIAQQLGLADA